jgi:protein-S-isoprenylcysteine O-methyltransferase Ste14
MLKIIIQNLAFALVLGALLFLPAGDLAWPQAWAFLVLFIACNLAVGVWLLKSDPALQAERLKSPVAAAQRPRDRLIMAALVGFIAVWFVFMALDARRFAWSHTPPWTQAIGAALVAGAFWGWVEVPRANTFASTAVRLQTERGQRAISTDPYAVVRHPGYA